MTERRTAADFVAAVCGLTRAAVGVPQSLLDAAESIRGPGTEEIRHALSGHTPELDAPDRLDELATRWAAPCLASLAVAIRSGTHRRSGSIDRMLQYLEACAVADATGPKARPPTGASGVG